MITSDDDRRRFYLEEVPVSHPSDALLLDWTTRIHSGERGPDIDAIAKYIIKDFALRQMLNVPQSPITLGWLAEALGRIIQHAEPLEALGLLPRPSRRPTEPQRGIDVCCWVSATEKRGYPRSDAIKMAADCFATDESNVRKMLKKWGQGWTPSDDAVWSDPLWDEHFAERRRPLPVPAGQK